MATLRTLVSNTQNTEMNITLDVKLKKCKTCHELLPLTDYYLEPRAKDRLFYSCKNCYSIYRKNNRINNPLSEEKQKEHNRKSRVYYENNKEKKTEYAKFRRKNYPRIQRNIEYKNKYGISIIDYDDLLEKQNNTCAICKISQFDLNYFMVVDHCHTTNKVRGLLCRHCNVAIGHFKDDIEVIKNSISYLEKFKEDEYS